LDLGILIAHDTAEVWRLSEQLSTGAPVTCYVNPEQPNEAVLQRASAWSALWLLFPLVFVGLGGGGLILLRRSRRAEVAALSRPLSGTVGARKKQRRAGVGFGGALFLFGLGLSIPFFFLPVLRVLIARSWSAVPCEIVSSRVASHNGKSTTYSVDVVYRYTIGTHTYTSARYKFMGGSSSGYGGKADIVARLPAGTKTICYIDPADSTNAVLERGFTADMWAGAIPLLFAGIGAAIVIARLKSARPIHADDPATVSSLRKDASRGTASAGTSALRPAMSRRGKLAGLIFVTLFWNGIVSAFLFQVAQEWRGGRSPWFLTIFLTPFVAIGAGFAIAAVRQALALFNLQAELTLTPNEIPVGGTAQLAWTVTGKLENLRCLTIVLEGREEATYRRGTDTKTDRAVFASVPIVTLENHANMQQGGTTLTIPRDAMHSFAASNNKIVWVLRVRGEIPRWPDLDDEFPVHIAPRLASS
jgi:hypothetical protein